MLLALLGLVAASGAWGATRPLGWLEQHTAFGRHIVFTYRVEHLVLAAGRWEASVSIHNDTNLRIAIHRNFALIVEPPDGRRRILSADAFRPRLPRVLQILGTWKGAVSGPGVPQRGSLLRLRFGTMSAVILPNHRVTHTTRHSVRL